MRTHALTPMQLVRAAITGLSPKCIKTPDWFKPVQVNRDEEPPRVLILDDDPTFCELLKTWIDNEGMHSHAATSIAAAMTACEAEPFDIALVDLHFHSGESGAQFIAWAHEHKPEIELIICTGAAPSYIAEALNEFVAEGTVTLMFKPFSPEQVIKVINRFLSYGMAR